MNVEHIKAELQAAASKAAMDCLDKHYGGDWGACGFAWVMIEPEHKGNTKLGKAERKVLEALGAKKDWTGKTYQIWNPSNVGCQNVDAKHEGAVAAAKVLQGVGINASAQSRLD